MFEIFEHSKTVYLIHRQNLNVFLDCIYKYSFSPPCIETKEENVDINQTVLCA